MSSPHGSIAPLPARWRAASSFLGVVTLIGTVAVGLASLGCGRFLALKGPGEPCTRTTECRSDLLCTAGVCMPGPDSGVARLDASVRDAREPQDTGAGPDVAPPDFDADTDAAAAPDAAGHQDVGVIDDAGEPADSGAVDAP